AALKNRSSGFDYYNRGILPRVRLAVSGDFTSIGAALAAAGVKACDIQQSGGETLFTIRKKDSKKAIAILNKMCYNYRIAASFGIGRTLAFCAARCGLIVGAVAAAVSMNILYGYVWRIQITGNEVLSTAAIEAVLKHADVRAGQKKSQELITKAATALGQTDGVSDASCEIVGTTLYVHVLGSKDYVVRPTYACYVSEYDATVTKLVVRSGTPLVKRGDVVKRGDTLISGDVYSTAGELLYTGDCDADVYGSVSIGYTANIPAPGVAFKRTGRKSVKTILSLFGKRMGKAKPPYRSYEMSAHTANYDLLVPLYVTSYTYWETKPIEYERDIAEVAAAFAEEKKQELEFVGELDYKYSATASTAGMYSVHLFLTGELLISHGSDRAIINT
ncbi:MAG: sporulation protein YqfD, partial [Clostridiales bacterium]|nr:sporulation protein YqfD [Clostridiales bacterium]